MTITQTIVDRTADACPTSWCGLPTGLLDDIASTAPARSPGGTRGEAPTHRVGAFLITAGGANGCLAVSSHPPIWVYQLPCSRFSVDSRLRTRTSREAKRPGTQAVHGARPFPRVAAQWGTCRPLLPNWQPRHVWCRSARGTCVSDGRRPRPLDSGVGHPVGHGLRLLLARRGEPRLARSCYPRDARRSPIARK